MEIYSVIKNDRPGNELVWKCEKEDFNTNTQLIVMESEEALFVKDGVIVETFTGGKYTLNTENYPVIGKLRKAVSGGESAFNCKIYFVDKTHKLELFWGTDSPIQIQDAKFQFMVGVRARGSYSIEIADTKKFLIKLVGVNTISYTEEDVRNQFRTVFQTKIKMAIANVMKTCNYTILDMNTELENIGQMAQQQLTDTLDEYGIRLVNFYVVDISIPENDPNYKKINEAYADAYAGKIGVDVQGAVWDKLAAKELVKDLANNPGAGGVASVGAGMGMGMASANLFGNLANQMFSPLSGQNGNNSNNQNQNANVQAANVSRTSRFAPKSNDNMQANQGAPVNSNNNTTKCPSCGHEVPAGSKFCGNCGNKLETTAFCKNCGSKLEPGAKFCGNCGTKRED
ncbi:MAG: SPFH domain-containing protein [Clostridia bacterium]|nr:SPFH domain-containing protein [Clostridia bacterium]